MHTIICLQDTRTTPHRTATLSLSPLGIEYFLAGSGSDVAASSCVSSRVYLGLGVLMF